MDRLPQFALGWQAPDPRAMSLLAKPGLAHFRSVPSSANPDEATAQTVRIMCRHIKDALGDPLVKAAADTAVRRWRGGAPAPSLDPAVYAACSDFWHVRSGVNYVHHEYLIRAWLHEADQLQLLIPPSTLLRLRNPEGDCAVYTMLLCAILAAQGIGYEIVTVATNADEPRVFNHVYPRAIVNGLRISLDAIPSAGGYPGWQVPTAQLNRLQVWNADGQPVVDEDARYAGLGSYRRRRVVRRGLGCGCSMQDEAGDCMDPDPCTTSTTYGPSLQQLGITTPDQAANIFSTAGTSTSASPAGNSQLSSFLQNFLGQWTKIAGNVIAPQTTLVRGPNGQMYYSSPAGSSNASLLSSNLLASGSSSSLLLIAGVLIGGVVLVKAIGK